MNTSEAGRQLVDGRFELISPLGSGGMGTVWRARDIALHREVALKEVRPPDPALAASRPGLAAQLRERAVREARALARLSHPHVVTIHHIVDPVDGSHPWIVMELVKGGSLYDRLTQGPLPVTEVRRLGLEVLSALRAAHAEGIQHRDVKPANVLLRPDGSAVLTDFGIAALHEAADLTATGDLIGSPEYIAPERVRGQEGNPASDLWSLGMMLYVAAEGAHPLRRATSLATVVAVLDEPIPYPARSGALAPVLGRVLVRDPAARPDGAELERLLRAAVADGPAAPAATPSYPAGPTVPPPAPGTPVPGAVPPHGGFFGPPATTPVPYPAAPARRPRRTALTGLLVAAVLAGGGYGVMKLIPDGSDKDAGRAAASNRPGSTPATGHASPRTSGATPAKDPTGGAPVAGGDSGPGDEKGALLTEKGARAVVAALSKLAGTTRFVDLDIYEGGYAIANIPTEPGADTYDRYEYRDGVAKHNGPGGTKDPDSPLIDMAKVNWAALPVLMARAERDLGVTKPTSRYVIIEPWVFDGSPNPPSMRPYLANAYGKSGYVYADIQGNVKKVYKS